MSTCNRYSAIKNETWPIIISKLVQFYAIWCIKNELVIKVKMMYHYQLAGGNYFMELKWWITLISPYICRDLGHPHPDYWSSVYL